LKSRIEINMKKIVLAFLLLGVFACSDDEGEVYDADLQLEIDIENIEAYLNEEGITAEVDETGIRYVILEEGTGQESPEVGDSLVVSYTLYNFNGTLLDTSIENVARAGGIYDERRTYAPLEFVLGTRSLISGFQRGAQILKEGGIGDFYIPSVFAYRNTGTSSGSIAPNESILFRIVLLELKKQN